MLGLGAVLRAWLEALSSLICVGVGKKRNSPGGHSSKEKCPGEEESQQVRRQDHPPDRIAQS